MGVKWLEISPTAQIMIHRAETYGSGNKNVFEQTAQVLSGVDASISNAYQIKTGIPTNELLDMMSKETWLTAQQAKEAGFVDAIMFETEPVVVNSIADHGGMLPQSVIDKIRNEIKGKAENASSPSSQKGDEGVALAKAKLNLTIQL